MKNREDMDRLRQRLAQEAARIMADQGIDDYRKAKQKAAERLGVRRRGALPSNPEIEAALVAHQSLFGRNEHHERIRRLRRVALEVMQALERFVPRLAGPVLAGTAAVNAAVELHLFCDAPEDVLADLGAAGISAASFERRVKPRARQSTAVPAFRFRWGPAMIEATVFPYDGLRQAPISPVDGRPMRRAAAAEVAELTGG